MTRLWKKGVQIVVETDDRGQPLSFEWNEQRHPIAACHNRWRVDVSWWTLRRWREHFKVTTTTGLLVIIYLDLVDDQWYLQRLYD